MSATTFIALFWHGAISTQQLARLAFAPVGLFIGHHCLVTVA
jgi:hypothetical protein